MKPDPFIANCQQVIGDPRFQDCSNLLHDGHKGDRIWGAEGNPDFGWPPPSCKLVYNPL